MEILHKFNLDRLCHFGTIKLTLTRLFVSQFGPIRLLSYFLSFIYRYQMCILQGDRLHMVRVL